MKLFVVAADAAIPEYILDQKHLFPNLCKLIDNGASSAYSAYVQKGYGGSYSSEQNWSSIYTGLTPQEHKLGAHNGVQEVMPEMNTFNGLNPFWEELNKAGITVGLWQGDCLDNPTPVNGYVVSGRYTPIFTPSENREAPRTIQVSDERMKKYLNGNPPPRLYPKTLAQLGFTFEQLKENPTLVNKVANEENFKPMLDNFHQELEYWFGAMTRAQRDYPVDVVWWFTPTTDILPHFTLWCDNNPIIIKAYKMLDEYIGEFVKEFEPENVIFMSDHGQQNFSNLIKCSNTKISREAFKARDKVIISKNGYIAFEALNGGLLFTSHSLKGVFIACGKDIRHTEITEMRTTDIYPTLLEILGIKVPKGRSGYVADIFDRSVLNNEMLLKEEKLIYKKIALIQTHEISISDIILNELYYVSRFAEITIVGEAKYEEIFRNNPRVNAFLPFENYSDDVFDEVYCGFYNETTGLIKHIRIK